MLCPLVGTLPRCRCPKRHLLMQRKPRGLSLRFESRNVGCLRKLMSRLGEIEIHSIHLARMSGLLWNSIQANWSSFPESRIDWSLGKPPRTQLSNLDILNGIGDNASVFT